MTSSYNMAPTATPAVRPFSTMHDGQKVVTDSAQRRLERKRANARIRQQRCRARKRARQLEDEKLTFHSKKSKEDSETIKKLGEQHKDIKPKLPGVPTTGRYWQPPPPSHDPNTAKNRQNPRQAIPANAGAWKGHVQAAVSYPSAATYYAHHQHAAAYNMSWYGAWSHAAAAAYYAQHGMHVHPSYPPVQDHPGASTGHKFPPASPLQLLSPMRKDSDIKEATTPYFEVEDIVKSPMRTLAAITATPSAKKPNTVDPLTSPESELLPPLWSTATKPTPGHATRSPWSTSLPSPSLMTNTPTANADWDWSSNYYHQTPALPLTTPIKTTSEIEAWLSASPSK